ncbi:LysM peptidoglycan-binding domain-containing protein [Ammoniphilus sp. CFH 90114]|uniref:LysM peptidoglycan-binding domain-containing protein n=1 Tax=Ammoniphilus sp. CFH 90114 TaxID=2493665 RepID=UPI00100DBE1C|nr:LysM peptidoglycan-binding domain-containing protein [Ammoniphilus sp. CFH 90114]RXT04568.1 LysM peptidoglycan-binding domain-containing protein [Ammoniphilus sp. CFH 90114]
MPIVKETHVYYTVQPGDTLYSIAARLGSTVASIQSVNVLYPPFTDPYLIYPGWKLLVPVPGEQPVRTIYITAPGDTLYRIAQRFSAHPDLLLGMNPQIQNPNLIFAGQSLWVPGFVYQVESGDTLANIAGKFGIPLNQLLYANEGRPGFSLDLLYAGYSLILPLPSSRNIVVIRPLPEEILRSGESIEGLARVFEANVLMQVEDDSGVIVSNERFTTASAGAPAYGYFSRSIPFDRTPSVESGKLWVYARSANDGSIIDLVQVKVRF